MSNSYINERELTKDFFVDAKRHANNLFGCDLDITARCNNNCRHCYINVSPDDCHAKSLELSVEEISEIAHEAVYMGAMFVKISGGEPLLRDDFSDIYLMLKWMGFVVSVYTNATLVNDAHVQLFRKYPPCDIEVTVYGVTESTYENVTRRKGSFDSFMHGLNLLLDNGIKVRLKAMALRSNIHELGAITEFCRARTKDYFRFDSWLHLRYDGNPLRNEEIKSERLPYNEFVASEMGDTEKRNVLINHCSEYIINKEHSIPNCDRPLLYCGAGNNKCAINHEGFFQLCSSLQHPECRYDLRKGSLTEAYRSLVPKVRSMHSQRKDFVDRCGCCSIVNFCLWCPANSYLETGELDSPVDYFCEVAHARVAAIQGIKEKGYSE